MGGTGEGTGGGTGGGTIFIVGDDDVEVVGCGEAGASLIADEVEFGVGSVEFESSILIDCRQEGHVILLPTSSSAIRIVSLQLGQLNSMMLKRVSLRKILRFF